MIREHAVIFIDDFVRHSDNKITKDFIIYLAQKVHFFCKFKVVLKVKNKDFADKISSWCSKKIISSSFTRILL